MTTEPINCNEELKRHFCNGAFDQRVESGQVERIVQRMIKLLEK